MANDDSSGLFCCCCLLIIIVALVGFSTSDDTDSTEFTENDTIIKEESLEMINMANNTIHSSKPEFVYYDHNTSKWNGCYGLNYTVLEDDDGNKYMLDHATTDILGEKTNYTFTYPNGIKIVYDNNTETEIYNNTQLYYVHEISDDNNTIIKSKENFTLNDKSHEPDIVPSDWLFVYNDHNSTTYEGDEGLYYAQTNNTIGEQEHNIRFFHTASVVGLAYYANKDFDFYKYGIKGISLELYNDTDKDGAYHYAARSQGLKLPNGTKIREFDIESRDLVQKEKNFLTNYNNRIDDVRHKQEINAMYDAEDDAYQKYSRYQNSKSKRSYYYGSNGYGVIYNP